MLLELASLACMSSVFSHAISLRREIGGLNEDSSWLKNPEFFTPPSFPTLSDTNKEIASAMSPDLFRVKPAVPNPVGFDDNLMANDIPTSIDFSIASISVPTVGDEVIDSFRRIKKGWCQFGIYVLSQDQSHYIYEQCGYSSDWSVFFSLIKDLTWDYALKPFEDGYLFVQILIDQKSKGSPATTKKNVDNWMVAIRSVFKDAQVTMVTVDESEGFEFLSLEPGSLELGSPEPGSPEPGTDSPTLDSIPLFR